jgi:LPXTG-motif cell wall-anchored protein
VRPPVGLSVTGEPRTVEVPVVVTAPSHELAASPSAPDPSADPGQPTAHGGGLAVAAPPVAAVGELPATGDHATGLAGLSAALLLAGLTLLGAGRRPRHPGCWSLPYPG